MINAFHPDYVRTHMPEFMASFRVNAARIESGKKHGSKASRKSVPVGGAPLSDFPKTESAKNESH